MGQAAETAPQIPFSYRDDSRVPDFPDDRPILIFDGECVFCSGFARFLLRHDRDKRFRFLAAQTLLGEALYAHYGIKSDDYESNILLDGGRAYFKSDGLIRMLAYLGSPWSLGKAGWIVPRGLRDFFYDVIARNRIRWFGRRESCYRPSPEEADRFLQ
ncbi:thiol-disulfide oxidoreductase DCC family protein [Methyloligella sp. 2.7D]|uniref:thiol-disulfide oxidoreductase DCC family protein n=1 Tax=unclassified Methyloligella TaxID=2625955 RepID=UPI00157D7318|nr:thiol-disulfide oxidoreductase DCC family protein [Methyloligella sp. GL2]QKP77087.1 thiol-disulfide oxidoreductase DCC family protein [Methyloligella sp. GL2]